MDNKEKENTRPSFTDRLDNVAEINKPAREDRGEDSFYCVRGADSCIVSVCDGCGGLGAMRSFDGYTGAYLASRQVSGALHDWYHDNCNNSWPDADQLAQSINTYIVQGFEECDKRMDKNNRIMGSMVRSLPTTLALAYAEEDGDDIMVHLLWAGDSRVYLLDGKGLAQLTVDDTEIPDAMDNIYKDGVMNNVLSSDGNYRINTATIRLTAPAMVFAATDGCFGYIPSPMEFEYEVLDSIVTADTPEQLKEELNRRFTETAGDDYAMGLMSFDYGSYGDLREAFKARRDLVAEKYIRPIRESGENEEHELRYTLWHEYKTGYERYLNDRG